MTCFSRLYLKAPPQLLLTVVSAALTACATAGTAAGPHPSRPSRIEHNTSPRASQLAWSKRGEPAELSRIIAELTEATQKDPSDHATWLKLAEAHCLMADGTVVLGWDGDLSAHLAAAESAALSALALHDRDKAELLRARGNQPLDVISEERGAAMYWFARSAYASAALRGYEALLLDHAILRQALHVAVAGAPSIDRGGPLRLMASLLAHPADPALRDLEKAQEHVQRSLTIDASNPANLIAYIEHYALPAQDGAAVTEKLRQLSALSASSPEDAIALARAEQLASGIEGRLE